eukprot:1152100-Pelagomonas_calceolata.AAC.4
MPHMYDTMHASPCVSVKNKWTAAKPSLLSGVSDGACRPYAAASNDIIHTETAKLCLKLSSSPAASLSPSKLLRMKVLVEGECKVAGAP